MNAEAMMLKWTRQVDYCTHKHWGITEQMDQLQCLDFCRRSMLLRCGIQSKVEHNGGTETGKVSTRQLAYNLRCFFGLWWNPKVIGVTSVIDTTLRPPIVKPLIADLKKI